MGEKIDLISFRGREVFFFEEFSEGVDFIREKSVFVVERRVAFRFRVRKIGVMVIIILEEVMGEVLREVLREVKIVV